MAEGVGVAAPEARQDKSIRGNDEDQGYQELPMTKSELIDQLADLQRHLAHLDVELGVKSVLEQMSAALANGERIEIRGFGSFSLHYRAPRMGRNPKTGDSVALPGKHVPHFKPGKALRERVDLSET
jgi:integration host factor subunit beta